MPCKPWLAIPAPLAHYLSTPALKIIAGVGPKLKNRTWAPQEFKNLIFQNPLGIAGGVDKNAEQIQAWWKLGAGYVEIGTITPRPQLPNPGVILKRNTTQKALWNKMGFPSKGVEAVAATLAKLPSNRPTPIFANIGKNRDTPNELAHSDYLFCMERLSPYVDAFVINISSPNTKGLRDLLLPENIKNFLQPLSQHGQKPLLLKISPDLSEDQLKSVLDISCDLGFDGWILTNTTLQRPFKGFPEEGGLSGAPLAPLSKKNLQSAVDILGDRRHNKLLISAGGIMNYEDIQERLSLGAQLVQVYSALIFEGPFFFKKVLRQGQSKTMDAQL